MGISKNNKGSEKNMERLILPFFLTDMRDIRKEKGVSITDMAKYVGTTNERVSAWECCKSQPTREQQIKIIEILEV